jgi:hypothetical protein
MARERQRLLQVKLLSPMSGLVAVRQNRQGMFFPGMTIPDVREGDQVQPGMPIADVLDLSELEVVAKIGELDRANLREGQDVLMRLDAVGDKTFHGKIKSMSGTASANIFSGDPAKKFDVVFSVDMNELLSGLGAKPEQIRKILAQAEINRKKGPMAAAPSDAGGPPQMAAAGGAPGAPQAGPQQGGPQAGGRQGGRQGGGPQVSPEDQQKIRAAMQKALNGRQMGDLSPEDRQKVMQEVAKAVPAAASMMAAAQGGPGGPGGGRGAGIGGFSERELENAKLPPPIDPENQLEVLLRPGLLADVEIILEKMPDAINIPAQAVFEKDGKQIVFVRKGSAWEERAIKPLRRSESVMIIASGIQPGETIAMADPTAKPGDKKKKAEKSGGSSAVGSLPGGGRS